MPISNITTLIGTSNQVLVNGTVGTLKAGALTLSLPQSINSGAAPTFAGTNFTNIPNSALTNSSLTVTAGSGLSGGGLVSLGGTITLTNAGVTSFTSNTGLSSNVSATGAVTVTNTGVTSNIAGTGISVSGATGAVTITNTGVTSFTSSAGLSTNTSATGAVSVTNTGVTSAVAGTGISVSGGTGAVTFTNSGVTSIVAGSNITISGGTGAVTINSTASGVTSISGTTNQITASASTGAVTLSTPTTFTAPGYVAITTGLYQSTTTGITAAGTTLGTATSLTTSYNIVSTVAAGTGVSLPLPALAGWAVTIRNSGANTLNIWPNSATASINGAAAGAAVTLAIGATVTIEASTSGASAIWYSASSFGTGGTGTVTSVSSSSTTGLTLTTTNPTTTPAIAMAGTLAVGFGGTGLTSTPTNGQIDIGNGTGFTRTTLTAGSGISITNGAGSVTIANPLAVPGGGGLGKLYATPVGALSGTTVFSAITAPTTASGWLVATSPTITPTSTSSQFVLDVSAFADASSNNRDCSMAIFRGTTLVGYSVTTVTTSGRPNILRVFVVDTPATTTPFTYTVRFGMNNAGTSYINQSVSATITNTGNSAFTATELY